jgi:fibronectin-binding autotransporter adhesin
MSRPPSNQLVRRASSAATVNLTLALATLGLGLFSVPAKAATFTWTNGTGDASWNTTAADWNGNNWSNSTASIALFGSAATPGRITVSDSMTLGGITFSAGGYDLTGGTLGFGSNAGTLTMNSGGEIDSLITGTAGLTTLGSGGALTLGGALANTISGTWYLGTSGGTINYVGSSGTNAFGTSTLNFNGASSSNYTLNLNGSNALSLASSLSLGSLGVLNLAGSEAVTFSKGFLVASGGTLAANDMGGVTFGGSTYSFGSGGIQTITGPANLTISGSITGANLNYGGSGILKLSGTNTLLSGGTINVNGGGTLQLGSMAALSGANERVSIASGGVLDLNGLNITSTTALSLNGSGINNGGALINSNIAPSSYAGAIMLGGASSLGGSNNFTLSSPIGDRGNGYALTKIGGGMLTFSGSNTYSGGTTVQAGILAAATTAALPYFTTGGMVAVESGAMLDLSVAGAAQFQAADVNNLLSSNGTGFAAGSQLGIDTTGGSLTCNSNIQGNMGLTKLGSNTLILTAANTYTGPTVVTSGSLQVGNGGASGGLGSGPVTDNSALVFDLSGPTTFGGIINGVGSLTQTCSSILTLLGSNTYSGGTTISAGTISLNNAGAVQNSTVTASFNNDLLFNSSSGAITTFNLGGLAGSGSINLSDGSYPITLSVGGNGIGTTYSGGLGGQGGLAKVGIGTLLVSGSNSYTDGTAVIAGTLLAAGTAALPGYATPGAFVVGSGAVLAVSEGSAGWTAADISTLLANVSGFANGSIFGIDTSSGSFSCNLNIAGSIGLEKLGGNTLILAGSNTYTGPTLVTDGTLQVGGGGVSGNVYGNITDNSVEEISCHY